MAVVRRRCFLACFPAQPSLASPTQFRLPRLPAAHSYARYSPRTNQRFSSSPIEIDAVRVCPGNGGTVLLSAFAARQKVSRFGMDVSGSPVAVCDCKGPLVLPRSSIPNVVRRGECLG